MNTSAYFKALGLEEGASWEEVKSAFRRLARIHHPDVSPDDAPRYAEITEAYFALKESIAPGASRSSAGSSDDTPVVAQAKRPSLLSRLWNRIKGLFSFGTKDDPTEVGRENDFDFEMSPAKERFIGGILSKAEAEIHDLMSRRGEAKDKAETEAILSRIASRHPSVTMLALRRVSIKEASPELRKGVIDHFRRTVPTSEVLDCLLNVFSNSSYAIELARALIVHTGRYTDIDAISLAKWFRRINAPKECFASILKGASVKVASFVLASWPMSMPIADLPETVQLLKSGEEAILVPLLRLLKKERVSAMVADCIRAIAETNSSPAVKVWASAIVREQNLS